MALRLYRRILRLHRQKLPFQMRAMGDDYVRSEFMQHKGAKPEFVEQFMEQWSEYAVMLESQESQGEDIDFGKHMTEDEFDALTDEQKVQLQKIRREASSLHKEV